MDRQAQQRICCVPWLERRHPLGHVEVPSKIWYAKCSSLASRFALPDRVVGDYVRYGPNRLLINTAEGLRDIYGNGSISKIVKSDAYVPLVHRAPNTLTIRGGKEHAHRRRIMAQGLSEKAQRGYEHRILTHIVRFCNVMFPGQAEKRHEGERAWSEPMDMSKWCKSSQRAQQSQERVGLSGK